MAGKLHHTVWYNLLGANVGHIDWNRYMRMQAFLNKKSEWLVMGLTYTRARKQTNEDGNSSICVENEVGQQWCRRILKSYFAALNW